MEFNLQKGTWINEPLEFEVRDDFLSITTPPYSDFWQRTYYGFRNDNAPAFLLPVKEKRFTLTVKTEFDSAHRFDQCGLVIYEDAENWFKASIEYENSEFARLGSVLTNNGYSDWATTDIPAGHNHMYYRLSRREADFLVENSADGVDFKQMRIFHLFKGAGTIHAGFYACSPENSSFKATFTEIKFEDCLWADHK